MYELLGMIKDGKAPKKIKYRQNIFEFIHGLDDYKPDDIKKYHGNYLFHYLFEEEVNFLNDEVEIIGEPKKIEHCLKSDRFLCDKAEMEHLRTKIDELIDEVNKLKGKK